MQKSEQDQTVYGTDRVLRDIAQERKRQVVVEGFPRTGDDAQPSGRLAYAGAAYAVHWASFMQACEGEGLPPAQAAEAIAECAAPDFWPLDPAWWKPHNDRSDLVRAAALLVAEIERMDRATA